MAAEMQITVRVLELSGGGYVIAEDIQGGDEAVTWNPTQAVSTIDEACGAVQRRLRSWSDECKAMRRAQLEDENVIPLKQAWRPWRAIK
jgi:hypothetical protein